MTSLWRYLSASANWQGPTGIWARVLEHLGYSAVTILVAALIAIPLGAWIGHTGRGRGLVVNLVNGAGRFQPLGCSFWPHWSYNPGCRVISPFSFRLC